MKFAKVYLTRSIHLKVSRVDAIHEFFLYFRLIIIGVEFIRKEPRRAPRHVIQSTALEGLAQGPYVAGGVGFEPWPSAGHGIEHYH